MSEESEKQLAPINGRDSAVLVTNGQSQLAVRARRDIAVFLLDATDPIFQLRKQAESGDTGAQVKLGEQYKFRCGWCLACLSGELCQEHGPGTLFQECLREAAAWYLKAAELGNVDGQIKIAHAYVDGIGVPKNQSEAERWLRSAAEQGDMWGQYELGKAYRHGKGTPKDPLEAFRWYRMAADQRHLHAIDELGDMYEAGEGVPQNSSEALRYFAMATEDDVDFDYWDPDALLSMWRKAAEYGCSRAQLLHGDTRFRGALSIEDQMIDSYMWYELAAANGEAEGMTLRDALAVKMSEAQIVEAQRRALEWKPKNTT